MDEQRAKEEEEVPQAFAAPWCERNLKAVTEVLLTELASCNSLLEIGSGTGYHSVHIAPQLPVMTWQCTNIPSAMLALEYWHQRKPANQLLEPIELDVTWRIWPFKQQFEAVFSANTLHIMPKSAVVAMFQALPNYLATKAKLLFYGAFKFDGHFDTQSNADFDRWLKSNYAYQGLRDFEWIVKLASDQGFKLREKIQMPANNQFLIFEN